MFVCLYVFISRSIKYTRISPCKGPVSDGRQISPPWSSAGPASMITPPSSVSLRHNRELEFAVKSLLLDSTCSLFFIQPLNLNLTELHRKSPEVVAQRNLVKIKSRSFFGTPSQKKSFISTEPARNQPSYSEKLNSMGLWKVILVSPLMKQRLTTI
ncbi:unnamed protein product [Brassica rapa subsp. trilocularis]